MEKRCLKLIDKEALNASGTLWRLRFEAPGIKAEPGQFVNIAIEGKYLRRPISVSEYCDGILTLVVAPVGDGTRRLVEAGNDACFDMLTGLGNTFTLDPAEKHLLLIGGGVGYAPLIGLMKRLAGEGSRKILAVFGFNAGADVPSKQMEDLRKEGHWVEWSTMTGESGFKGNAIEAAKEILTDKGFSPDLIYTCGPMPMMNAVCSAFDSDVEMSMEARMGCGFGACMGCTVKTADGPKRICKEGPVFRKNVIFWE